jgi:hypothetical protein
MKKLFVIVLITLTGACGPKLPPNTSIEAKAAIRGDQLVEALRSTIPSIKQAICQSAGQQNCLTPDDVAKVANHLGNAGRHAQELATVLSAVDDAKTASERQAGMQKANAILTSISNSLTQATVAPNLESGRQLVVSILGGVTTLLFTISSF